MCVIKAEAWNKLLPLRHFLDDSVPHQITYSPQAFIFISFYSIHTLHSLKALELFVTCTA